MAKKDKAKKKRNPQDTTLRNVRSTNARIIRLASMVKDAVGVIGVLELRVKNLESSVQTIIMDTPPAQARDLSLVDVDEQVDIDERQDEIGKGRAAKE